ncbi:MAG: hypothetical protein KAG37_11060 [Flavobacteriales bacterium]|nr:hypothetical protein [Flavobacteriales bacterium]
MPSNLNALIRYKQIDKCLRNKYVDCTIARMIEMCSEQLGEYRGVYKKVSERTIRDDIKTMRGDSLGFNAPITVSNGTYIYSEENFSIFNSSIDDMDLLKKILLMLIDEKDNISSSNLSVILNALSMKTGITLPVEYVEEDAALEEFNKMIDANICYSISLDADDELYSRSTFDFKEEPKEEPTHLYSWKDIFGLFK